MNIIANPFSMWLAVFVISHLGLPIECIDDTTITLWSPLINIAFSHAEDPVLLRAITVRRISFLSITTLLKTPKLNNTSISGKARCYVVVFQKFIFVGVEHILVPVSQFHLTKVMQTLKHHLVLRVLNTFYDDPNVVEVGFAFLF